MDSDSPQRIVVTDIHMSFGSMIKFMVKWAIASIPALIILVVLSAACWGLITGFFAALGSSGQRAASAIPSTSSSPSNDSSLEKTQDGEESAYVSKILVRNVTVGKSTLGDTGVFGEIKNSGDRTLKRVEVKVLCLGANGNPVFEKTSDPVLVTSFGFGDNEPLKPGYSRQFGINLQDAPSDWARKVKVQVSKVEFQ